MKLTWILVLSTCLQVAGAPARSQGGITLSLHNVSLEQVFLEIKHQSKYKFLYNDEMIKKAGKVNVEVRNASIEMVLTQCFLHLPLGYKIKAGTIIVTHKEDEKKSVSIGGEVPKEKQGEDLPSVGGKVMDENGKPVAGATVIVKGTNIGTLTNDNGQFSLKDVKKNATLIISNIGYESQNIVLKGNNTINVILKIYVNRLDETVIIAYGATTERLKTGNVFSVKAADIAKQPVSNPLLALEGRVPGLFITQSTGLPGSGVTVRIQGLNSIASGNDPFYVIDGIPYTAQLLPTYANVLGGSGGAGVDGFRNGAGNPLSYINPADIESIDILKDADATSIYGSRAANGAILITTKKGKAGQTKVDINMQNGWGKVTRKLDLLNTQQYLQMRHEALRNDGLIPDSTVDFDLTAWDTTRYTDWQKVLIGGMAKYTDAQISVSGGNTSTQFLAGAGYHRETTVFPGDLSDQKGSLHFSINHISLNQKFRFQLTGNYLVDNNRLISTDLTQTAITLAPDAPPLYNADGSLNWAPLASGNSTWQNPLSYLSQKYKNKANNLVSSALISYQILPGLDIKSSFGYTYQQSNETDLYPLIFNAPEQRPFLERSSSFANNNITTWIVEPQVSYETMIGKGKLMSLIGTTIQQNNSNTLKLSAAGFISDAVLEDPSAAAHLGTDAYIASVYKYNALFSRINYNWKDKYLINFNGRRDGSSRFGSKNRFHDFSSIGAGWVFSNEPFIQKNLPIVSFGKIRGSYGTTGNDQISNYLFLSQYKTPPNVLTPYQGSPGLLPNGLYNPYLQWEETKKLQFGLDLGFFKDRVLLNMNYFHNRSSNLLLPYTLPLITGFGSITKNFPATIQNSGWEFALNTMFFQAKDFTWSGNINLTLPENKLVAFPNLTSSSYADILVIGQPITVRKVFHLLGVDPATGVYQFADSHGKSTSSPVFPVDQTVLENPSPKFYGGIENRFRYKGFELDFLFQIVKQTGVNYVYGNYPGGFYWGNQPVSVLDRWQKAGDIAAQQRYNTDYSLFTQYGNAAYSSDAAWSDASYIRLRNVSLSWQFPGIWMRKAHIQNCRLYMQGENLLTITHYKGLDPETPGSSFLPPLRIWTMGVQLTL
ncbi:TonB-linked SusC/RagA family outer membrane protein [Chitinophaga niastensis]|uniref:TonB-linked SusC/RagA family outer membrane protein n=1 Tax=Chitinophaga niastensis TaxID=536980 RepID=A0A2P8HHI3_CHINA|nr:SusC/RagA family TonB-linked outer membrane protein [Chitinophaga niastensis]PSL45685.1 TonB-linked SusC/RagA family outer membrane protein [Chitinophaga niastensis]